MYTQQINHFPFWFDDDLQFHGNYVFRMCGYQLETIALNIDRIPIRPDILMNVNELVL